MIAVLLRMVLVTFILVMENRTFNVYEAARELGCTSQWIRVLLAEQRLDGARKVAGVWQIPADAVDTIKQRREAVTA
jgi:hypothetical protein